MQLKISQKVASRSGVPDREFVVPDAGKNMEECKEPPKKDPDKIREDIVKLKEKLAKKDEETPESIKETTDEVQKLHGTQAV